MVRVCPFRRKESKENITFGICAGNRRRQLKRIPGIFRTDTSVVRFKTPGYVRYWLGRTCSNAPTVYLLFEQTPDRSVFPSCTPTSFEACRQFCRRIRFGTAETRSLRVQVFAKRGACRTERKGETTSVTGDGCTTVEWLRVRASGIRERERTNNSPLRRRNSFAMGRTKRVWLVRDRTIRNNVAFAGRIHGDPIAPQTKRETGRRRYRGVEFAPFLRPETFSRLRENNNRRRGLCAGPSSSRIGDARVR